jgi:hypothetical protein
MDDTTTSSSSGNSGVVGSSIKSRSCRSIAYQ